MSLNSRTGFFMCQAEGSTTYLYPKADIERALELTPFPYTYDGTNIVCPTMTDLKEVYYAIWYRTSQSNPDPLNPSGGGYTCNKGTILEDMGEDMQFMLSTGEIVVKWRLVRQLSPQTTPPVATPGNSPNGTIGFTTVFCAFGRDASSQSGGILDPPSVMRLG